jgi:hypothetical protein
MEKIHASDAVLFVSQDAIEIRKMKQPGLPVVIFVLSLLALIFGVNSLVQMGLYLSDGGEFWIASLILGCLFCLVLGPLIWVTRLRKAHKALPREELELICSLDLTSQQLLAWNGEPLSNFKAAKLKLKPQWNSRSKKLVIQFPEGQLDVVHGNPFSGGVGGAYYVLGKYIKG